MEESNRNADSEERQDNSCCSPTSHKGFGEKKWQIASVAAVGFLVVGGLFGTGAYSPDAQDRSLNLEEQVLPSGGVLLKVVWGSLGLQMTETGVIEKEKLLALYKQRGGMTNKEKVLLESKDNGYLIIDSRNAGALLNLLWAFGLANDNPILREGPMVSAQYGEDASRFASTGGWTLSQGNAMDHYSRHSFVVLSPEQQALVERAAKNIYRPCCGNSTYFPDCNHGMAMLGLLELMAAQNMNEEEMYRVALQVNSYWFPETYLTIAIYFQRQGIAWEDVNAKEVLGAEYSSAQGYQRILAEVRPPQAQGGGSCGV